MTRLVTAIAALVLGTGAAAAEPAPVWRAEGFAQPVGVVWDPAREWLVVANLDTAAAVETPGYLATLAPDGNVRGARWVAGFETPKGLAVAGDRLYVSDVDNLVELDARTGAILARYPASGAAFFDDLAADARGRIYAADSISDAIWRLADGTFSRWVVDPDLDGPHALQVWGDRLYAGAWGPADGGGAMMAIDLETGAIERPESLPAGMIIGGAEAGGLWRIDADGRHQPVVTLTPEAGDPAVAGDLLVVPNLNGTVTAWPLPPE